MTVEQLTAHLLKLVHDSPEARTMPVVIDMERNSEAPLKPMIARPDYFDRRYRIIL